jgi:hypothetical protein
VHTTKLVTDLICKESKRIAVMGEAPAFTLVSCSAYFSDLENGGDMFHRNVG